MSSSSADPGASFWSSMLTHGVGKHRTYKYFFLIFAAIIALEIVGSYGIIEYVPCMFAFGRISLTHSRKEAHIRTFGEDTN